MQGTTGATAITAAPVRTAVAVILGTGDTRAVVVAAVFQLCAVGVL